MNSAKELKTIIEICDGTRGPEDEESTPFETIQRHAESALASLPTEVQICREICKLCKFYEGCAHVFEHKAPGPAEDERAREAFESGYARGHCDTVEGCVVEYERAATEYLRDLAKKDKGGQLGEGTEHRGG